MKLLLDIYCSVPKEQRNKVQLMAAEKAKAEEDISGLCRKLETTKKPDMVPNCDEILMEEINDCKACLTCLCCSTHKKDAVLTKCFHVFCLEYVRPHYGPWQRKCPKCSAAFRASDSHRINIG